MIAQLSQFSPGISLGWAVFSLLVGLALLVYIVAKVVLETRSDDAEPG